MSRGVVKNAMNPIMAANTGPLNIGYKNRIMNIKSTIFVLAGVTSIKLFEFIHCLTMHGYVRESHA